MTEALVRAQALSKVYAAGSEREVVALQSVDLEIKAGEFVAITGPSGSGKSTLASLIGGLDVATTGVCTVAGQDIASLDARQRSLLRLSSIGFVFQSFHLMAHLTALENVMLPLLFAGVELTERRHRAEETLQRCGLLDRASHRPTELSGGQQQRVAIARAMVNRPTLMLADEPTGALDTRTANDILALLQSMQDGGMALVVITHDLALAAKADRRIHLRDGRIEDVADAA